MIEQTLAIVRNTFFESIRQPIVLVILVIATIFIVLSNPLSAFTMEDDQRMLIDMGMATVFLAGALLAGFVATGVLTREIENKTVLTVVSKPVTRPVFLIGKFLGVAGALVVSTLYMSFVFLLSEQHTVLQTVRDPIHVPVIVFSAAALVVGIGAAVWCNFFYGKVFASTAICFMTPLAGLAYLFSMMFRPDFSAQSISVGFKPQLWLGLISLTMAVLVLTAIAIAFSTRLGQVLTLCATMGIFLGGLLSDHFIGQRIAHMETTWLDRATAEGLTEPVTETREIILSTGEVQTDPEPTTRQVATVPLTRMSRGGESVVYAGWRTVYALVPNFQVLWLSDALTQGHRISVRHVALTSLYGVMYIGAAMSAAVILFQGREVG